MTKLYAVTPAYVNHMQSTLSKYPVNGSEAGIKIVGRNINKLRYLDGITEKNWTMKKK